MTTYYQRMYNKSECVTSASVVKCSYYNEYPPPGVLDHCFATAAILTLLILAAILTYAIFMFIKSIYEDYIDREK